MRCGAFGASAWSGRTCWWRSSAACPTRRSSPGWPRDSARYRPARCRALNYGDIPTPAARTVELKLGTDQAHVFVGVPVSGVTTQDRAPLRVLNAILGRTSGRLFTEIRDKRGLAYTAYSSVSQFVDGGIFMVYAGTQAPTADAVLGLLKTELQRIREQPVDDAELQNAINGEIGGRTIAVETSANEALYMARDTLFGVPPRELQAAETRAVTAADVQRVAQKYLDPSRLSVVVTRPVRRGGSPMSRPAVCPSRRWLGALLMAVTIRSTDPGRKRELGSRSARGGRRLPHRPAERHAGDRAGAPRTDVVAISVATRGGSRDERSETVGAAHFMEHMYFQGTPRRADARRHRPRDRG